jgi:hypothetical protein
MAGVGLFSQKHSSNYHMKSSRTLVFFLLLSGFSLQAQEQLGLRTGNFAGVNGWFLNPSSHTSTPFNWDINLAEGAFFFDNNYTFLQNTRLTDLAKKPSRLNFAFGPDFDKETPPPAGSIVQDFYDDGKRRYGAVAANLAGPAFYVRLGEQHAVGLFTRARFHASGFGVSSEISYYQYFNRPFFEPFETKPFKMALATWSELGINYLYQTPTANGKLGIGISARYLQGYEGIFFNNVNSINLAKLPGDSLAGTSVHFEYGHTNSNLSSDNRRPTRNGTGVAFDLGATWLIGDEADYTWRIGFSILDIGRLQFNNNARLHEVNVNAERIIGFDDYNDFAMPDQLEGLLEQFSVHTLGAGAASLKDNRFGMWLPGAVSLHVDRNLGQGFFLNGMVIQGVPLGRNRMARGSLVALTPRFESRWVEFAMPVSFYHGNRMQLGLAGRVGFLTLGTDRIGSIFTRSDFNGTDFYFALKIQPFRTQETSADGKDPRRSSGARNMRAARASVKGAGQKCYKFR